MARLNKKMLGGPQGALGDLVFREMDGDYFISTRPVPYMPGADDPLAIDRRLRFAINGKVSRIIKSFPLLDYTWRTFSGEKKRIYQKIFAANYSLMNTSGPPEIIEMSPPGGFSIPINSAALTHEGVQVDTGAIGALTGIDPLAETTMRMECLIYLKDPFDQTDEPIAFIKPIPDIQNTVLDTGVIFSLRILNQDSMIYNQYSVRKAYFVLLTLNTSGNVIHYSTTLTKD